MLRMLALLQIRDVGQLRRTDPTTGRRTRASGSAGRCANVGRMARQVEARERPGQERAKFGNISGVESILMYRECNRASVAEDAAKCVTARFTAW